MKVYLIHPKLTLGNSKEATIFLESCLFELEKYSTPILINDEFKLLQLELNRNESVVFFNNKEETDYSQAIIRFFQKIEDVMTIEERKQSIFPIAFDKEIRRPPKVFEDIQSFDVIEQLRSRGLGRDYIPTIATALARTIIARRQPTIYQDKMNFFVSHRRIDGENVAANFCNGLRSIGEKTFRDLFDIQVGENAQEIIEAKLIQSDAVIFLDTPLTGESYYVQKELTLALTHNIPIIWVRIGAVEDRIELKVKPNSSPHFSFPEINEENPFFHTLILEDIINKAFEISKESAIKVYDQLQRLKDLTKFGVNIREIDRRKMLYCMSIKRSGTKYAQKPLMHIVQMFGRSPKEEDVKSIGTIMHELSYVHPELGQFHDMTLLLAPGSLPELKTITDTMVIESSDEYISEIERLSSNKVSNSLAKKKIIISGAFPNSDLQHHQKLTDAIFVLTQEILNKRGNLIFGAHPTFQYLIFGKAQELLGSFSHEYVTMYISEYFSPRSSLKEFEQYCKVILTKNVENNLEKSLTELRTQMICKNDISALIVLGGKDKAEGQKTGVDEEVELALKAGIPVYLIGSVGGRSAQLASCYYNENMFHVLNNLSIDDNLLLMLGTDYRVIFEKILMSLER